ncbi:MAG: hypothetical protein MUO67_08835, partial [Anaerolineales bacterium]|nr:hypothetical protein [Anaerolineales bacterium]
MEKKYVEIKGFFPTDLSMINNWSFRAILSVINKNGIILLNPHHFLYSAPIWVQHDAVRPQTLGLRVCNGDS